MPYVVSTLANSQEYAEYEKLSTRASQVSRPAVKKHSIIIKGGAGVQGALHTPQGVLTKVTAEDIEFLENNRLFKQHVAAGHLKIVNREVDPEKVAKDLKTDTGDTKNGHRVSAGSAQLTGDDFEEGGRAAGVAPNNEGAI